MTKPVVLRAERSEAVKGRHLKLAKKMWQIAKDEAQKFVPVPLREWDEHQPHMKNGWIELAKWVEAEMRKNRDRARDREKTSERRTRTRQHEHD